MLELMILDLFCLDSFYGAVNNKKLVQTNKHKKTPTTQHPQFKKSTTDNEFPKKDYHILSS